MKYSYVAALLVASGVTHVAAVGDGTTTNNIKFGGLPGSYTYQRATSMSVTGSFPNQQAQCTMGDVQANGPLAPLTNEMAHILRGPIDLYKFAVYQASAAPAKRDSIRESPMERRGRLAHINHHKQHAHNHEKRNYGDLVTATIDGKVVTFTDTWSPHQTPAGEAAAQAAPPATQAASPVAAVQEAPSSAAASASPSPAPAVSSTSDLSSSSWTRMAFFDKDSQTAENIMFTANNNFVMGLGNTQGYVASNGVDKADGPQILNAVIPDNYEVIISSASPCTASDTSGGCAVTAPGSKAFHGFGGDRVVIMEYTMPQSISSAPNKFSGNAQNTNLPAIWALGQDVVNIAQYGVGPDGACSGWSSGAGEFDIHEILPGNGTPDIGYASFHMGKHYSGTPPSGFVRPTDPSKTQKLAYILSGNSASIHILGSDFDIDSELTADDVQAIVNGATVAGTSVGKTNMKLANAGAPAYQASTQSTTFDCILGA